MLALCRRAQEARRTWARMLLFAAVLLSGLGGTGAQNSTGNRCAIDPATIPTTSTGFSQKTFVVALHEVPPFVKQEATQTGNSRFSGITVELLDALSKELSCKFDLVLADAERPLSSQAALDAVQFQQNLEGSKVADIAAGAIRIASNRSDALLFTLPFYDSGFQLIVRATPEPIDPTGFFDPFHDSLWALVCLEMLVVAMAAYYMEAPACEPAVEEPDDLAVVPGLKFGFFDSLYWAVSVLIQTPDKAPCTWGGKVTLMAHGWFMLIVMASYTANLANFLTTSNMAERLSSWTQVQESFGQWRLALPMGSAHADYIRVQQDMYGHEYNITWTRTFEDAFAMVEDGVVDATFHDEPIAQEYLKGVNLKECKLLEAGKMFSTFGYGLAFPASSADFIAFSQAIVKLKENGDMRRIIKKYGVGAGASGGGDGRLDCTASAEASDSMSIYDIGGLLYMTAILVTIGFAINSWERYTHDKAIVPCLQPCQDLCCPKPLDIADDDEEGYGGGREGAYNWAKRRGSEDSLDSTVGATPLTVALSEGVKKGILQAVEEMSAQGLGGKFTAGMSGVEMMEHAGFVENTPRGLLSDVGDVAGSLPGVNLLFGGLSSVGSMVGVGGSGGVSEDALSPRRPYSFLNGRRKSPTASGAISVDTSDAGGVQSCITSFDSVAC